ncbi:MAG TPA: ATP-binding cassette domain-containing protein [Candidatus Saccharimonadales bacterium]|nr:ATP-binding cassette domain-containing protein [Candidatus Saccharimonadales bacterium]
MTAKNKVSTQEYAIRATNLHKAINGAAIVHDASLAVPQGEIALLTGESGSGKSTVMRMIAGIEHADSGDVSLFGQNMAALRPKARTRLIAGRVGVGFQSPNLHTNLTARENLYGLSEARGQRVDYDFAAYLITQLKLTEKLDKKAAVLSGGEKLRVALGRILLPKPELLLLDEPTAALDGPGKQEVVEDIATICHELGATALIVTHEVDTARPVADREFIMASGRLQEEIMHDHSQPVELIQG